MDPLLGAFIGLISAGTLAFVTAFTKKWRTPADDREDRSVTIDANDALLDRFTKELESRDKKISDLDGRLTNLSREVEGLRMERFKLIDFIYVLVRIIRSHDAMDEIPEPVPAGIFITGLVSEHQP